MPTFYGATPSSSASLFGAISTPQPALPLFGGQNFGNSFSNVVAQPTGLFGSQQPGAPAQAQLTFAAGPPQAPDMSAVRELESIKDSYLPGPTNTRYRCKEVFEL